MSGFRQLEPGVWVSGQISADDLAEAARMGIVSIVNHRPDGEGPDQPTSAEIAEAAGRVGLAYRYIPTHGLPDAVGVSETGAVLTALDEGQAVLMFCKSGGRSAAAWALARRHQGMDAELIRAKAAAVGYDLSGLPL